jgi:hypothetical protein
MIVALMAKMMPIMESESSFLNSQESASGPYPKLYVSIPRFLTLFKTHFNIILPFKRERRHIITM